MISTALELDLERVQREALFRHASRVQNEMQRQLVLWGEQNHPDGTGELYKPMDDLYHIIVNDAMKRDEITWAQILLEEIYETLSSEDDEGFEKEIVQVEAVLRSWVAARARRKVYKRAQNELDAIELGG